jgi:hypothetical protein
VEFFDKRLSFPYRKYRLSRVFNEFRHQLQEERNKAELVKQAKGGEILKQLIYNYKLSIFKQKEQHKVEAIKTYLADSMAVRAITALT